jgi:hypothetical protein
MFLNGTIVEMPEAKGNRKGKEDHFRLYRFIKYRKTYDP